MSERATSFKLFGPIGLRDFLVIAGALSLFLVQMPDFANDPAVGWHLRTGEYILSKLTLITNDLFLGGVAGRPWVSDQWLADLMLFALFSLGSWAFVYTALAVIYLVTYFFVLYRGVLTATGAAISTSFAILIAFKMGQVHFILRPVLFSFFFFALVYVELIKLHQAAMGSGVNRSIFARRVKRAYVIFPIIFCMWSNVHPAFVLGAGLVGFLPLALLVDSLCLRTDQSTDSTGAVRPLFILTALSLAATLLNPYGWRLHETILFLSQSDFAMRYYAEWQAPNFRGFEGELFQWPLILIAIGLYTSRGRGLRFFDLGLVILFAHWTLSSVRMLPFLGIVSCVPVVQSLQLIGNSELWSRFRFGRLLKTIMSRLELRERRSVRGELVLAITLTLAVGFTAFTGRVPLYQQPLGPSTKVYPERAIEFLKAQAGAAPLVVVNEMDWGGYVTLVGYPTVRSVIDDRTAMIGNDFYKQHFANLIVGKDVTGYLTSLNSKHLLLRANSELVRSLKLDPKLSLVYEDATAVIFQLQPLV